MKRRKNYLLPLILVALVALVAFAKYRDPYEPEELASWRVGFGDTVWDIAMEVKAEDDDVRDVVKFICKENGIVQGYIKPDTRIVVPYNRTVEEEYLAIED